MSESPGTAGVDRLRALAAEVARRVGGVPAVRALVATLARFDAAGGGLAVGGLTYAGLVAVLPGLLLLVAILGVVVDDPAARASVVDAIAAAAPPLEDLARAALDQAAAGAVPTSVVALAGLLWASSRFYASLDDAFARVFHGTRRRGGVERAARGLVATVLAVLLPVGALSLGSLVTALADLVPADARIAGSDRVAWLLASPVLSVVVFVGGTALVYRLVPTRRVPLAALGRPALAVGVALAAFTQAFGWLAPRLVGAAALYGSVVALFALLAWLSIGFQLVLLGAAWTSVRLDAGEDGGALALAGAAAPAEPGVRGE